MGSHGFHRCGPIGDQVLVGEGQDTAAREESVARLFLRTNLLEMPQTILGHERDRLGASVGPLGRGPDICGVSNAKRYVLLKNVAPLDMDDREAALLPEVIPHHHLPAGARVIVEELEPDSRDLPWPGAKNRVFQEFERLRLGHAPKAPALLRNERGNVPTDRAVATKQFPKCDHRRLRIQKIEQKRRARARHTDDNKPLIVAVSPERPGAKGQARNRFIEALGSCLDREVSHPASNPTAAKLSLGSARRNANIRANGPPARRNSAGGPCSTMLPSCSTMTW